MMMATTRNEIATVGGTRRTDSQTLDLEPEITEVETKLMMPPPWSR
jgi:hypothetical protein